MQIKSYTLQLEKKQTWKRYGFDLLGSVGFGHKNNNI